MLKTKFSIGEGTFPEGRENWFCRFAKYCACLQSEKCSPIAQLLTCVACLDALIKAICKTRNEESRNGMRSEMRNH